MKVGVLGTGDVDSLSWSVKADLELVDETSGHTYVGTEGLCEWVTNWRKR